MYFEQKPSLKLKQSKVKNDSVPKANPKEKKRMLV